MFVLLLLLDGELAVKCGTTLQACWGFQRGFKCFCRIQTPFVCSCQEVSLQSVWLVSTIRCKFNDFKVIAGSFMEFFVFKEAHKQIV